MYTSTKPARITPFISVSEVNSMVRELSHKSIRDMCLFVLGCNTGLIPKSLLCMRWKNCVDPSTKEVRDEVLVFDIRFKKRGIVPIPLNEAAKLAVKIYFTSAAPDNLDSYMFVGRQRSMHLTSNYINKVIKKAAGKTIAPDERRRFSSGSMRKTFLKAFVGHLDGCFIPLGTSDKEVYMALNLGIDALKNVVV